MVSVSSYYFATSEKKDGSASVCKACQYAYINNYSSIVLESFSSLLLDFVPDLLIDVSDSKRATGIKGIFKKCVGFIVCIKDLYYVNERGIAQMSISGDTFCESSWVGFMLNLKHSEEYYFAINSGEFIIDSYSISIIYMNIILLFLVAGNNNAANIIAVKNDESVYSTNWYYKKYIKDYLEAQNMINAIAFVILVSSLISN